MNTGPAAPTVQNSPRLPLVTYLLAAGTRTVHGFVGSPSATGVEGGSQRG
jgi:hypothetical protein